MGKKLAKGRLTRLRPPQKGPEPGPLQESGVLSAGRREGTYRGKSLRDGKSRSEKRPVLGREEPPPRAFPCKVA